MVALLVRVLAHVLNQVRANENAVVLPSIVVLRPRVKTAVAAVVIVARRSVNEVPVVLTVRRLNVRRVRLPAVAAHLPTVGLLRTAHPASVRENKEEVVCCPDSSLGRRSFYSGITCL